MLPATWWAAGPPPLSLDAGESLKAAEVSSGLCAWACLPLTLEFAGAWLLRCAARIWCAAPVLVGVGVELGVGLGVSLGVLVGVGRSAGAGVEWPTKLVGLGWPLASEPMAAEVGSTPMLEQICAR